MRTKEFTKEEMAMFIIAGANWSKETKLNNLKIAMKHNDRKRIKQIFDASLQDMKNGAFYANLLLN